MAPRKPGSLTGSKRFQQEKEDKSIGIKAKALADGAGVALSQVAQTTSDIANTLTTATAKTGQVVNNTVQTLRILTGYQGYTSTKASSQLTSNGDPYGGLSVPHADIQSFIPPDLLKPQIALKASEEELTTGLMEYAAGTRAQQLLQAGYKFIEEVGKTKLSMHKAQSSVIKAVIEHL